MFLLAGNQETMQLSHVHPALKHPLKCKWAMWYFELDESKEWSDNNHHVLDMEFLEDFWVAFNNLLPVSKIPGGCSYSLFKHGIEPKWEDPRNEDGGRWMVNAGTKLEEQERNGRWLETMVSLIGGEEFKEYEDQICGATISAKSMGDRLALWTSRARDKEVTCQIGRKLYDVLDLPDDTEIGYQVHADSQQSGRAKLRYTITKSGDRFQESTNDNERLHR